MRIILPLFLCCFLALAALGQWTSRYHGAFTGDGGGLTNLQSTNIVGTIPLGNLASAVVTNNESGLTLGGTFSGSFTGNGAGLTNIPPSGLASAPVAAGTNITAQTNGGVVTVNAVVPLLGIAAGTNITAATNAGVVTISASASGAIEATVLDTNGTFDKFAYNSFHIFTNPLGVIPSSVYPVLRVVNSFYETGQYDIGSEIPAVCVFGYNGEANPIQWTATKTNITVWNNINNFAATPFKTVPATSGGSVMLLITNQGTSFLNITNFQAAVHLIQ